MWPLFLVILSLSSGWTEGLPELDKDVLSIVPLASPLVDTSCPEDYSPCSCHQLPFMDYIEVACEGVDLNPSIIQSVLNRTTKDPTMLRLTIPASNDSITIPEDAYGGKRVLYTVLTCSSSSAPIMINSEAFRSSRDASRAFEIRGCDLGQLNFAFLAGFSALRALKFDGSFNTSSAFRTFPKSLGTVTDLSIADSSDFYNFSSLLDQPFLTNLSSLEINNCHNFTSFEGLPLLPALRSLVITKCPRFQQWDVFGTQLTRLNGISLSGSRLGDEAVSQMLDALIASPVAERLTYLNLRENALTRIPEQISRLPKLRDLNLAYNRISSMGKSSLKLASDQVATLYLFGNHLTSIGPNAFEGDLGGARIDLQNNNLSLFEASTFRSLLEKMKGAETSSADFGGRLLMYQNPINCDCHLAWLIRDRQDLLQYITLGYCSNGTSFHRLNPTEFADCVVVEDPVTESIPTFTEVLDGMHNSTEESSTLILPTEDIVDESLNSTTDIPVITLLNETELSPPDEIMNSPTEDSIATTEIQVELIPETSTETQINRAQPNRSRTAIDNLFNTVDDTHPSSTEIPPWIANNTLKSTSNLKAGSSSLSHSLILSYLPPVLLIFLFLNVNF